MATESAPVLSTPAEHTFEDENGTPIPSAESRLSYERLYIQYEIKRTVDEIQNGRWRRIALQFPDEMLVDAPRVYERLRQGLKQSEIQRQPASSETNDFQDVTRSLQDTHLDAQTKTNPTSASTAQGDKEHTLCILGDTSYGACCVDEVAAEHVEADVVVHYGRACLSPTARLPVIYVYTSQSMDFESALSSFRETYSFKDEKICLMADIPYSHHLAPILEKLVSEGYTNVYATNIIRDPSSPLPNRTLPPRVRENPDELKNYTIFHISQPPTSLLLILSSRVREIHIFSTTPSPSPPNLEIPKTHHLLRRRYGLVTQLSTASVFGILINTLSVANYMDALQHCQDLIAEAGKKSYVFVVGKVNAAKLANFAEIDGWVVIGCWESSLVESKEFFRAVITPFELEVALMRDEKRVWSGEWIGFFGDVLSKKGGLVGGESNGTEDASEVGLEEEENMSDDEPPEFDLRTGRYVSHSRPMGQRRAAAKSTTHDAQGEGKAGEENAMQSSSALVQRAKGEIATINGTVSPAAEFLRSQRTWQGLGSDYEIAYERDEDGRIRGAVMEEGRGGVAAGYRVGDEGEKT